MAGGQKVVSRLNEDFTGCQRLWSVGPAELETGCTQSETFARSYTDYGTRNQKAAGEESYVARKPSVVPGVCVWSRASRLHSYTRKLNDPINK